MNRNITNYKTALNKHQNFIDKFKQFPPKSRKAIYAELLQLPLNHGHFIELTKPYPLLPEHTVDKQVAFIVSAFCRLYPVLGNQWLPGLIYPFVRLFKEDAIAAFEISLSFIVNWFRPILNDYPNSSQTVMAFFSKHLSQLQKKVNSFDYPLSAIVQPLLLVAMTDILTKEEILQVYDYLVSHPYSPQLYICIAVTIVSKIENKLCKLGSIQDIAVCLRQEKKINIQDVIKEATALAKREEQQLSNIYQKAVFPLSKGRYPVCQFIQKVEKNNNKKMEKDQEEDIHRLEQKYSKLQNLVNQTLQENQVNYIGDINKKYSDVQGQLRQYLRQVQEQHQQKWQAIKKLEDNFKDKVNSHNQDREGIYEHEIKAIQRRGRVEREMQKLQEEDQNIRRAEREMLKRIEQLSIARKEQMILQNARLREEQRLY